MKRIVITADDFGAAREVNEAIEIAHREGVLTAASLMVGAPETADAVERARRMPSLRVGLHLVLTDGRPLLPPSQVPRLVDKSGAFPANMTAAGATMFFSPHARIELAAEIAAQFAAFRATGLPLDHANAHKHFHLHPTIARLMASVGQRFGLRAVRVPHEPRRILARVESETRSGSQWLLAPFAGLLRRRMRAADMLVPDSVFGLAWSGRMTKDRFLGLVRNAPEGLSEIYLHPATSGGFPGAAEGYRYAEELAALLSPDIRDALSVPGVQSGGFAEFLSSAGEGNVERTLRNAGPNRSLTQ